MPENDKTTFWTRHFGVFWGIVLGLVAVWRFTSPPIFNRFAVSRMTEREWQYTSLHFMSNGFEVAPESLVLLYTGFPSLLMLLIVLLPSATTRQLTAWSFLTAAISSALGILSCYTVIASPLFWNALFAAALIISLLAAVRARGFGWLVRPIQFLETRGQILEIELRDAGAKQKVGQFAALFLAIVLCINVFWLIPIAVGRFSGDQIAEKWLNDSVYLLLHMKNRESLLHQELVEVLVQNNEYALIKLAKDVPHPKVDDPTTQPVKSDEILFSGTAPMLVRTADIESMTMVFSVKLMTDAIETAIKDKGLEVREKYQIKRSFGGGYQLNMSLRRNSSDVEQSLQPTSAPK